MVGSIRPEGGMGPQEIPPDQINRIKQQVDELKEKLQDLALKLKPETSTSKPTPMGLLGRFVPRLSGQAAITEPSHSPEFLEASQRLISALSEKADILAYMAYRTSNKSDWLELEQFVSCGNYIGAPIYDQKMNDQTKIEQMIHRLAEGAEAMPSEAKFFNDLQAQLKQILK